MVVADYRSKMLNYKEENVFDTLNVNINLTASFDGDNKIYSIDKIDVKDEKHTDGIVKKIEQQFNEKVSAIDTRSFKSHVRQSWSSFYTLKELIDIICELTPEAYINYYRGQSGNWELKPTLFRKGETGYSEEFRGNYDKIYQSIAQKFPDEIKYCPDQGSDDRASNLAVLQHYGLGTPLVDITQNPFIAMLFMVGDYKFVNKHSTPRLDIFFVKENNKNTLFQEVSMTHYNQRISAQKGAFLNFEKLNDDLMHGNEKISKVTINLIYNVIPGEDDDWLPPDNSEITQTSAAKIALTSAVKDIEQKLKSFHYVSTDLFPDFYKYLEMLKKKHSNSLNDEDVPWYQINNEIIKAGT